MSLRKIKKWLNRKFYISLRSAKSYEEKDSRLVSNADCLNIIIVFFIFAFAFGIFSSMLYFRRYIDPSYQEEKNKILIRELYKDLDRIKRHDQQRNNFLHSLQGFMSDKDDIYAESGVKNYACRYFGQPAEKMQIISNEDALNFEAQVEGETIAVIQDGLVLSVSKVKKEKKSKKYKKSKKEKGKKLKKGVAVMIQHDNGFVSVCEFAGKVKHDVGERVKMGETLGSIKAGSPLQISLFIAGQQVNANKFFSQQ